MKKRLPFIVMLGLSAAPVVNAAFQDSGWGARPIGMGGAFTAVADDANAALYNPAGLVQIQWNELSAMYAQLFTGLNLYAGNDTVHLDQSYLAFTSKPIPHFGSWGLSWTNFTTTHLYREDTLMLTYAHNVGDFIPALDNALAFGVNVKYLHRGFTLDAHTVGDPVFSSGDTRNGATADVGLLYKPQEGALSGFRIGLVAQNFTQPNVGFQDVERVPLETRLGFAYQSKNMPWLVPALDITHRDTVTEAAAGIESWLFHDALGLRAGLNRDEASAGMSYYQTLNKKMGFRLDYGFTVPYFVQGTSGSHRVAASVYF